MMTNIQRNPTIPMTKRDSLLSNGTRVSLLANGSNNTTPKKFEEKDYVNTNANMVAGKKRSPKPSAKVKRTASYKIATNRQSADDLDGVVEVEVITDAKQSTRNHRTEDRAKYNTLPRTDTVLPQKKPVVSRGRKREIRESHSEIERSASQKSGTYPSPDTDEDQRSIPADRKKKSTFKRMKERLILNFKRNRDHETEKGTLKKSKTYKSQTVRVKPNQPGTRDAFNTPNNDIEDNNNTNHITKGGAFERNHTTGVTNGGLTANGGHTASQSNKGSGILKTIRNSFRRKQAPTKFRKGKGSAETSGKTQYTSSSSQPTSGSSLEREGVSDSDKTGQKSQPIDIHPAPVHTHLIEEHFIDADDSITEIFGSLIDPEGRTASRVTPTFHACPRPDTSKLRLEGLKKCKPRSFDRSSSRSGGYQTSPAFVSDLSPTVEIDGFDYADAPTSGVIVEESDLEYGDVSQHEQHRRVDDVAKRLAAIGDSIASRIESESAGSSDEVTGFMVGSQERRLSQLEQELLTDLRRFGDEIDGTLFNHGNGMRFSATILPIISNILRAQDYSTFRTVIHREISNTVGWEQVAWYTYLMKATMDIAGAGKTVGTMVKNNATRYFSSTIKPWIQRQPNGWDSIHEESETECEVD